MTRPSSWRAIAKRLADRMYYQAFCDAHSLAEADPDNCPHCDDRAAYQAWVAKQYGPAGPPRREPGPTVTLEELRRREIPPG